MEFQRTTQQWTIGGSHIKWGAVFAGLVVGMAAQMTFTLLGIAIGAWSVDFHEAAPTEGIPTGGAIYTGVTLLISAFIGGFVTARMAGSYLRADGLFHGAVVWGLTGVLSAYLATTAMASLVGGIFSMFGSALQAMGQGAAATASAAVQHAPPDRNMLRNLRAEIESALQATEKPELQPGEISKDVGRIAEEAKGAGSAAGITDAALREVQGKLDALDREAAVNLLVNKFGLSQERATQIADSAVAAMGSAKGRAQSVQERSIQAANATVENIGSAAWWLFVFAVVTLGMSMAGGALGVSASPMVEAEGQTYRADVKRSA